MYIEYLYPIEHYFKVIKKNEASFDLVLPIIITLVGCIVLYRYKGIISEDDVKGLLGTIITLLSILVGFTITSIAILTTTGENLKQETNRKIGSKVINLHQLSTIFFIFALFSEIVTLMINLSALVLIYYNMQLVTSHLNIIVAVNILLVSHILFINVRNVTNFYFMLHYVKSGSS